MFAADLIKLPSVMLSVPKLDVSIMLGKSAALATPMLAFVAITCSSASRISGRASSKLEGNPSGGIGGIGKVLMSQVEYSRQNSKLMFADGTLTYYFSNLSS